MTDPFINDYLTWIEKDRAAGDGGTLQEREPEPEPEPGYDGEQVICAICGKAHEHEHDHHHEHGHDHDHGHHAVVVGTMMGDVAPTIVVGPAGDTQVATAESSGFPVTSVQGTRALLGQDQANIEFHFGDSGDLSTYGGFLSSGSQPAWTGEEDWTAAEKAIVRSALDDIEKIINVTFVETSTPSDADLDFIKNNDSGSLGTAGSITFGGGSYAKASVRMNHTISSRWLLGKEEGGRGYETLVHEIGHALGLGHTHDTSLGSMVLEGMAGQSAFSGGLLGFNDPVNSIMAYRDGWAAESTSELSYGNRGNMGAWDMPALINLYGAAPTPTATDDTYTLPEMAATGSFFTTIRDEGGTDTISAGGSTLDAMIDLRMATLDLATATSGGPVSYLQPTSGDVRGGFTIESTTQIENAIGGSGNDLITGNAAANDLSGGAGADTIDGGSGADVMKGGAGNDIYIVDNAGDTVDESVAGSNGFDIVRSSVTANFGTANYKGGVEAVTLTGSANINAIGNLQNNIMTGNIGSNVINGQAGADNMRGRGGNDTYVVDNAGDFISESLAGSSGFDRVLSSVTMNLSNAAQVSGAVERIELTGSGNINAIGNLIANGILGNSGDNYINGLGGSDNLTGGGGADSFAFTTALGTGASGNVDTINDFTVGTDRIVLENAIFVGLSTGALSASNFRDLQTGSRDADDFILYNSANGALFYDSDGSGATAAEVFAIVDPGTALSASDFFVV